MHPGCGFDSSKPLLKAGTLQLQFHGMYPRDESPLFVLELPVLYNDAAVVLVCWGALPLKGCKCLSSSWKQLQGCSCLQYELLNPIHVPSCTLD